MSKKIEANKVSTLIDGCGIFIIVNLILVLPIDFIYHAILTVILLLLYSPYSRLIKKLTGKTGRKELKPSTFMMLIIIVFFVSSFIIQTTFNIG